MGDGAQGVLLESGLPAIRLSGSGERAPPERDRTLGHIDPNGELSILPPKSKPGASITFRAEMDLIVGLTACSAEKSNNHKFKPIGYEIFDC